MGRRVEDWSGLEHLQARVALSHMSREAPDRERKDKGGSDQIGCRAFPGCFDQRFSGAFIEQTLQKHDSQGAGSGVLPCRRNERHRAMEESMKGRIVFCATLGMVTF